MKVSHNLQGIPFEWDSHKAEKNLNKHGISFKVACESFFDPFAKFLQNEVADGEIRECIIGMTNTWQILYVVHTIRDNDVYRIISARRATKLERQAYENQ